MYKTNCSSQASHAQLMKWHYITNDVGPKVISPKKEISAGEHGGG